MSEIEITPSKVLRDAPIIFKLPESTGNQNIREAKLWYERGETDVPLRRDHGFLLAELTLGEAGEYTLQIGAERRTFTVHEKEDLSFSAEFWILAVCVVALLIGIIRWDLKGKKRGSAGGSS